MLKQTFKRRKKIPFLNDSLLKTRFAFFRSREQVVQCEQESYDFSSYGINPVRVSLHADPPIRCCLYCLYKLAQALSNYIHAAFEIFTFKSSSCSVFHYCPNVTLSENKQSTTGWCGETELLLLPLWKGKVFVHFPHRTQFIEIFTPLYNVFFIMLLCLVWFFFYNLLLLQHWHFQLILNPKHFIPFLPQQLLNIILFIHSKFHLINM